MMKHNLRIIAYLMVLFFTTQIVGLYLLNQSIETVEQTPEGDIEVVYSQPITGRPELEGQSSFSYILAMVLVGTAILLVIMIMFQFYQNIAQQHSVDMNPAMRKFIGG